MKVGGGFQGFWGGLEDVCCCLGAKAPLYSILESARKVWKSVQRVRASFWRVRAVLITFLLRVRAPSRRVRADSFSAWTFIQ